VVETKEKWWYAIRNFELEWVKGRYEKKICFAFIFEKERIWEEEDRKNKKLKKSLAHLNHELKEIELREEKLNEKIQNEKERIKREERKKR